MRSRVLAFITPLLIVLPASLTGTERELDAPRMTVGILLFDGVQIIDFTGPYEVFGQAGMKVWTASAGGESITTHMGLKIQPTYALTEAPQADILVLPGGNVPHMMSEDDPRISWIEQRADGAKAVLSVCNGVFYLTSAGLLDGQRATTYALMLDHLRMAAPTVQVVSDERVVDNGKIITAGGLSAGIDGAMHLVARYLGEARARLVANNMEYDWRPDREYNRARLADVHINNVIDFFPPLTRRVDEIYEGTEDQWRLRWRIIWPKPVEEMREQFVRLAQESGWKRTAAAGADDWDPSNWAFVDHNAQMWQAHATIIPLEKSEILLEVTVKRERAP